MKFLKQDRFEELLFKERKYDELLTALERYGVYLPIKYFMESEDLAKTKYSSATNALVDVLNMTVKISLQKAKVKTMVHYKLRNLSEYIREKAEEFRNE